MKAVFDTKPNSGYDDEIVERYQFPIQREYNATAESAVGDWIVYRSPQRDGGLRSYIAVARVLRVEPDRLSSRNYYAIIGDYLPFDRPVPFHSPKHGGYWEGPLRGIKERRLVGAAVQGKSLRPLADADFVAIVSAGLAETLSPANATRLGLADLDGAGFDDVAQRPFDHEGPPGADDVRRVEQMLVNRKIRDANFRYQVCVAYEDRCAVTGLKVINGGGRSEVQAAHIWGVAEGGPDVVQNGLALSGTAHWLFDRHLISLTTDYRLLVSHNKVPAELRALFERQMDRIHLPKDARLWPHPTYVERHREAFMAS